MPFTKETAKKLGKKGVEAKREFKELQMAYITGGGLRKSLKILDDMLEGKQIRENQKEGVELLLKFMPYEKPKKTEETVIVEDKRVILD